MAGMATANFTSAMKTLYLDPLEDQIVRKKVILSRLEKNSQDIEGNFAYVALETTRNPGVGFRKDVSGDGPHLPEHGRGGFSNATFDMAFHYGRGKVSGPVMRRSKSNSGAFAKALDQEMKNLSLTAPEDLNRKCWISGHGRAATLAANITATTATSFVVRSDSYFPAKINDRVYFATISSGAKVASTPDSATITNIERDTDISGNSSSTQHRVTISTTAGAAVTAASQAVYFGNQVGTAGMTTFDSSHSQTMHGIPDVCNSGNMGSEEGVAGNAAEYLAGSLNYGGIDRSSNSFWKAQDLNNGGTNRALTVAMLQQAWLTQTTVGGVEPGRADIYTNPGLWATMGLLFVGDRRLSESMTVVGGFTAIKFNDSLVFFDRDCPRDVIWFLDMDAIMLLTQGGYEFINDDGSTLRDVKDRDAWEFTIVRDVNIGARKCKSCLKLDDITSSVTGVEANE